MPASAGISSSGSTLPLEEPVMQPRSPSGGFGQQRPFHSPGAITTPSAGRTRVLLPEDTVPGRPGRESPSTLNDGAVERYKTAPRTRGAGSKIAIGVASLAAVALAALVIVRVVTPQAAGGDKEPSAQNDSPATGATGTPATTGETEHAPRAQPPPPPPPAISVITLLGLPPEALVRLDGHAVTPPVSVPRDPEIHHLIIDANGYHRWETSFDARSDHTVAVEMKPVAAPPPVRAATPRPHKRGGDKPPKDQPGFDGFTDL
jgi:hypothetical protein